MATAGRALTAAFVITVFGSCAADDGGPAPCPATSAAHAAAVCFGSIVVQAELATTLAERQAGLMQRTALPDTAGMLFVFAGDAVRDFWMKDTPINLSIAFLDSSKTILNIREMTANDAVTVHRSSGPARYALEMKEGWFTARGIAPGTKATFTLPTGLTIDP